MANSAALPVYRVYELPWTTSVEQEQAFRRILRRCVVASVVLAAALTMLPTPERASEDVVEIPQRFASLLLEREPPPPPVVREEPEPLPVPDTPLEPEPMPEPQRVVQEQPIEPPPVREPVPVDQTQQARDRARSAGLLPFAEQLAALRSTTAVAQLDQDNLAGPVDGAGPVTERSLITARVGTASGGINTAQFSRNTGGSGLGERATTQVDSPVAGLGPAGGAAQASGMSDRGSRSREEIELVFDRNKGAIYALYNRALRENPALEGKLVLRLTIAPDGTVTFCEIVSSELGAPDLEQKLVQRVMLFQFEAKDVEPITTTKPIDFFPA
jgi:protein TonB